jgi:hypothetical protein
MKRLVFTAVTSDHLTMDTMVDLPLPDSSSFFQQRPMSVYNTPVQDCL